RRAARRHRDGRDLHLHPKKRQRALVWAAYSRREGRIVAYHIGDQGVASAIALYRLVKAVRPNISIIYTDANSCYRVAFERHGVPEPHVETKAQTHLIESANSSIRDNLARFNRRSKRASKSLRMLDATLTLFLNRHLINAI